MSSHRGAVCLHANHGTWKSPVSRRIVVIVGGVVSKRICAFTWISSATSARAPTVIIIRSASIITHARSKIQQGRRRVGGEPNNNSSSSISILTKRPAANPSRENILLQFPFRFSSFTIYIFVCVCVCAILCQCLCIRLQYLAPKYIKVGFFTLNLLDRCRLPRIGFVFLFFSGLFYIYY